MMVENGKKKKKKKGSGKSCNFDEEKG